MDVRLQQLKEKAIKENNAIVYKAIIHYENYGDIVAIFNALYEQTKYSK